MTGYQCAVCGQFHDELPMDLAQPRPAAVHAVPEHERNARVYLTDDLCVIDEQTFFIRGVLYLPVKDSEQQFGWGIWAEVDQSNFVHYLDLWRRDAEAGAPPFPGWLAGGIKPYPGSDMLEVMIQTRGDGQRPVFSVVSHDHPLGIDQRFGISMTTTYDFVVDYLPQPTAEN